MSKSDSTIINDGHGEEVESEDSSRWGISRRSFLFTLASTMALGLPRAAQASLTNVQPFSFAFVSDVHLTLEHEDTYELFRESQLFLQQTVKRINEMNLDFVVFGGDMIHGPGKDEGHWNFFLDIVQGLNCQWYFVLGEDDVTGDVAVDKMKLFGPDWKGKGLENDKPYWSLSPEHNVHLIGLDTSVPDSKTGRLTTDQIRWLKADLAANVSKFTIVFSHHPLLAPHPYDSGPPFSDYACYNGASARELIGASPYVRLAISGHIPINEVQKEANTYYVSCPSLITYPCAFKVFRIDNDQIKMETHQIDYRALVKKGEKALLDSSLSHHYNKKKPQEFLSLCEGDKLDNNAVLPLYGGMTPQPYNPAKQKGKAPEPIPDEEEAKGKDGDKPSPKTGESSDDSKKTKKRFKLW